MHNLVTPGRENITVRIQKRKKKEYKLTKTEIKIIHAFAKGG